MKDKRLKYYARTEIENFIIYTYSNKMIREKMIEILEEYMKEDFKEYNEVSEK